LGLERT